jgi:acetylornithine/N-succinyldiaminopimelate aminotransferase
VGVHKISIVEFKYESWEFNMSPSQHLTSQETCNLFEKFVIPNYKRYPVNLVKGFGSLVWDSEGREYLDFFPGWGCNLLGHCPPRIVEAVQKQVATLIHVPNTWHMESQGRWAQLLVERSFDGQAFFCNSGAEANEAAIKLARLHQSSSPENAERYKIMTFLGGFHGRTYGALAATAQPKYHEGLGPMLAGFTYVPFNDLAQVENRIDSSTAAIMIEPIQGEGGVRVPSTEFLQGLRKLADEHKLLLIFDEVQSGCGRTGHWFGYQYFGVEPDIITLAKSLCGGVAGGAMIARRAIAPSLRSGMHASTFGGNPLAAAAGIAMIETIEEDGLLEHCQGVAERFAEHLRSLAESCPHIREVRQAGLMIGVEMEFEAAGIVRRCLEQGLLINCTQGNVVRLLPAMNIELDQVDKGMEILAMAVREESDSWVKSDSIVSASS